MAIGFATMAAFQALAPEHGEEEGEEEMIEVMNSTLATTLGITTNRPSGLTSST